MVLITVKQLQLIYTKKENIQWEFNWIRNNYQQFQFMVSESYINAFQGGWNQIEGHNFAN